MGTDKARVPLRINGAGFPLEGKITERKIIGPKLFFRFRTVKLFCKPECVYGFSLGFFKYDYMGFLSNLLSWGSSSVSPHQRPEVSRPRAIDELACSLRKALTDEELAALEMEIECNNQVVRLHRQRIEVGAVANTRNQASFNAYSLHRELLKKGAVAEIAKVHPWLDREKLFIPHPYGFPALGLYSLGLGRVFVRFSRSNWPVVSEPFLFPPVEEWYQSRLHGMRQRLREFCWLDLSSEFEDPLPERIQEVIRNLPKSQAGVCDSRYYIVAQPDFRYKVPPTEMLLVRLVSFLGARDSFAHAPALGPELFLVDCWEANHQKTKWKVED